jgi:hypothetical protein
VLGSQRDVSAPDAAPVSNPATFDPMANGPQPPALEPRLAAVANIADPHLRRHVEANVRLQTQRQIAAFTDAQRQAKAQAKQVIDQGGDLSSIPAKLMLQIDIPGRQALQDYAVAQGQPATDLVSYYGLKNQALDDPAGFQSVDIANHMARLKPSDYAELQQLQTNLRNGQPPADLPLQQAYKANTDRLLQQLGLPTGTAGSPDVANDNMAAASQAALLRQAIDQHVAATEIATGRKLTPAEHRDMSADVSYQSVGNSRKNTANDNAPVGKSVATDSDTNPGTIALKKEGQTSLAVQNLASSLGERSAAECRLLCSELALPTIDYGVAFHRCLLACQSGGQSGFPDWDTHF